MVLWSRLFLACLLLLPFRNMMVLNTDASLPGILLGLVLHMFGHANLLHCVGNFLYGMPYMWYLETKLGWKKMMAAFVFTGLIAAFTQIAVIGGGAMIGSSGAIMGMVGLGLSQFKQTRTQRVVSLTIFLIFMLKEAMQILSFSGVANAAHMGGLIAGFILPHLGPSRTQKPRPSLRK